MQPSSANCLNLICTITLPKSQERQCHIPYYTNTIHPRAHHPGVLINPFRQTSVIFYFVFSTPNSLWNPALFSAGIDPSLLGPLMISTTFWFASSPACSFPASRRFSIFRANHSSRAASCCSGVALETMQLFMPRRSARQAQVAETVRLRAHSANSVVYGVSQRIKRLQVGGHTSNLLSAQSSHPCII